MRRDTLEIAGLVLILVAIALILAAIFGVLQ